MPPPTPQSSEPSVDQINASLQAIHLLPPAQEGLNPILMNPPQVLVKTCLTTHLYTQEKDFFFSQDRQKAFLCCLPLHTCCCESRIIHNPQNYFRNIQQQCRVFWKGVSVPPTVFTKKQTNHTHCYCRQKDSPTCMLQLWKTRLHLLSTQTTTNKLRDFGDYSTFSLYSSKKITLQDQLPTSFSFFWLKRQEESFKSLDFLYFPLSFW